MTGTGNGRPGRSRRSVWTAVGWLMLAWPAAAQTWSYTGSIGYSTGRYVFDQRSSSVVLQNGVSGQLGRFRFSAGVPLVWQNSEAVNLVGDIWIPTGGPDNGAVGRRSGGETIPMGKGRQSGRMSPLVAMSLAVDTVTAPGSWQANLADPVLSGAGELWRGWGVLRSIEVVGAVKPSIASIESGVGTGAWDWSAGASVTIAAGRALLFADASYWWNGDMPDLELLDGFAWGAAAGLPIGRRFSLMASLAGSETIIATMKAPLSVSLAGSWSMGRQSLYTGIAAGLSEASPDVSLYAGWRVDVFRGSPIF